MTNANPEDTTNDLCSVEDAAQALKNGSMVVLLDEDDAESSGSLVLAAEFASADNIGFMIREARGLVALAITESRAEALSLQLMNGNESTGKAFTVSVNARDGLKSGGVSAADRAQTIQVACGADVSPSQLTRPGHVFPIRAKVGGVLVRAGVAEAAIDLTTIANLRPAGVTCEILNSNGELAKLSELKAFAREHALPICSIERLIEYRLQRESIIERVAFTRMPTSHGYFDAAVFRSKADGKEHVALCHNVKPVELWEPGQYDYRDDPILVRVHSECLTGDAFGSMRCDCGGQLSEALRRISESERGALLYMRQEGRGIGLGNKLRAYELQDQGFDTVEANHMLGMKADQREYGTGAQMLRALGIRRMLLMSNNPRKFTGLDAYGLEFVERVPIELNPNEENRQYLADKRDKMGHLLRLREDSGRHRAVPGTAES